MVCSSTECLHFHVLIIISGRKFSLFQECPQLSLKLELLLVVSGWFSPMLESVLVFLSHLLFLQVGFAFSLPSKKHVTHPSNYQRDCSALRFFYFSEIVFRKLDLGLSQPQWFHDSLMVMERTNRQKLWGKMRITSVCSHRFEHRYQCIWRWKWKFGV